LNTFREDGFGTGWLLRCAIPGLAVLCFAVSASAVDPTRTVSQYLHDSWETERGLPGGSITAIAQTSDGYLWIGTDKGLVRFDGLNFQQFERAHPNPILIGPVRTLLVDASDNLWILLQNTQVFRYQNGNFELIRGETENGTTAMARGTSGAVLLSSLAVGTVTYSDNRFRSLSSTALPTDAPGVVNSEAPGKRATPFSWFDRLAAPTSVVISIAQTDDGKIWLGTERRGLFSLQGGRVSGALNGRVNTEINCLLPLQTSELWVGTAQGVLRWNGTELTLAGVPSSLRNLDVLSILRDRDSNIWVGTSRGLFRYNANGVSLLSTHETTGPVAALFEDRDGKIWIGSARGLERLRDSAFVTYSLPNLKSQSMGPLHVDSGGRIWIAPIQGGLRWLKEGKSGVVTADGIANDIVYSITGTGKDDVWVGRRQGGLTHLRYSGNSFTAKTYTQADGLAQNRVYAVYQSAKAAAAGPETAKELAISLRGAFDTAAVSREFLNSSDSTVWAGTLSGGVSRFQKGKFRTFTTADGLSSNTVNAIVEDHAGTMWFGTPNGLSLLSKGRWKVYGVQDGLPSASIDCLTEDSAGVLWIGSEAGLAYLRSGRVSVPKQLPPSLHEMIAGIAVDRTGTLWIATSAHVVQVNRNRLLEGTLGSGDVHVYGLVDGLRGSEGVKRCRSVVADALGRIWFSLNQGISVADPAHMPSFPSVLPHLEAVSADGVSVDLSSPVRISSAQRRITFDYAALSLSNREPVKYRYMLADFDAGWSEPVTTREAIYTNLRPGSYRFRLLAGNGDDLQNHAEVTLPIAIEPQFWQTWWFLLICVLSFLLSVLVAFRIRMHQVNNRFSIRLEERVEERTRIARELHDTLLQSFQGLMLRFQAVHELMQDGRAKKQLQETLKRADQAISEGRNAVYDLRSSTMLTNDFAQAVRAVGAELDTGGAVAFSLAVEGGPREFHPIIRDELYRITREALRNAFNHAHAHRIEVEITYAERLFRLRIRDDGEGIPPEVLKHGLPGHYGLNGMRERAEQMGAKFGIWSGAAGAGTEIELTVSGSIAYGKSANRFRLWPFRAKVGET
jgi:ligand-binding sensor domain-containing protein/signal transduction histidine kinase